MSEICNLQFDLRFGAWFGAPSFFWSFSTKTNSLSAVNKPARSFKTASWFPLCTTISSCIKFIAVFQQQNCLHSEWMYIFCQPAYSFSMVGIPLQTGWFWWEPMPNHTTTSHIFVAECGFTGSLYLYLGNFVGETTWFAFFPGAPLLTLVLMVEMLFAEISACCPDWQYHLEHQLIHIIKAEGVPQYFGE